MANKPMKGELLLLTPKGGKRSEWSVTGESLNYKGKDLKGTVPISHITAVEPVIDMKLTQKQVKYFAFEIQGNFPAAPLRLATSDRVELEFWIDGLQQILRNNGVHVKKTIHEIMSGVEGKNIIPPLFAGETIKNILYSTLLEITPQKTISVNCFLSNFKIHLGLSSIKEFEKNDNSVHLLHSHGTQATLHSIFITSIMKIDQFADRESFGVEITTRDLRKLKIKWGNESMRKDFLYWTYLYSTTKVNEICSIEYFKFCPESEKPKSVSQFSRTGYIRYDPVEEYKRMGIPNAHWRIDTTWNSNYSKIGSYPSVLVFPEKAPSTLLEKAVSLRTRNRMPVLCYLYTNGAAMVRSSQPRRGVTTGVTGANSKDEQYLEFVATASNKSSKKKLYVYDARSFSAAQANRAIGGGFEDYKNTKVIFLDIENIHVVRESAQNLLKLCNSRNELLWYSKVGETNWLSHIYRTIRGAQQIVETLLLEKNVLVHCSDGWDRTAQLTSISMILLDPHYRTINGFELLIEKEWLSFGHQFQLRTGVFDGGKSSNEESPIFLQFLEMVNCLISIYPCSFEFNEDFLIQIFDHLYSCLFGTFMYDCEKDRRNDAVITNSTVSLWLYLDTNKEMYTNPLYKRYNKAITNPVEMKHVLLWKNIWQRWDDQYSYSSHLQKIQLRELYLAVQSLKANQKPGKGGSSRDHSHMSRNTDGNIPIPNHLTRQATTNNSSKTFVSQRPPSKKDGESSSSEQSQPSPKPLPSFPPKKTDSAKEIPKEVPRGTFQTTRTLRPSDGEINKPRVPVNDFTIEDNHNYEETKPLTPQDTAPLVKQLSPREIPRDMARELQTAPTARPGSSKPAWLNNNRRRGGEGQ